MKKNSCFLFSISQQ